MRPYVNEVTGDWPTAYWRFGETSGTLAADVLGRYTGTHTGTVTVNQAPGINTDRSVLYAGGKTSVNATPFSGSSKGITVEFWAKKTNTGTANSAVEVATSANLRMLNIHLQWSDNNIYWDCGPGLAAGDYNRISKACDFDVLQWHHYAFVKDIGAGAMYIYVDGIQWHSGTGLTAAIGTPASAYIGGYAVTGVTDVPIAAYMDEFAVYSYPLTEERIAAHYMAGLATFNSNSTLTISYGYGKSSMRFWTPRGNTAPLTLVASGASGGNGNGANGGSGLQVTATLPSYPGMTLNCRVGGRGQDQISAGSTTTGGWPGAGGGGAGGGNVNGASGGGYTQITGPSGSVIIAGGGGGAGSHSWNGGESGAGGTAAWQNGGDGSIGKDTQSGQGAGSSYVGRPGLGGTTSAGGAGGLGAANGNPSVAPYPGTAGTGSSGGTGGNNYSSYGGSGGGGGGGNYGGGGGGGGNTYGGGGGGGAGSSYVGGGGTYSSSTTGSTNGNGYATITLVRPRLGRRGAGTTSVTGRRGRGVWTGI